MREPRVRVLHMVKGLGLGGTEKVMQLLAVHLDRSRFEPLVFSPVDGERRALLKEAGVPVCVGADPLKILHQFKPDIVHLHRAGWPEPELLRPVKLARVPAVVETNIFGRHDPSPSGRLIDCHLFVSRFCAERFAEHTGIAFEPPAYQVLYNPVDTDFFARHAPTERDYSLPAVGRVSRADPGKWSVLAMEFPPLLAKLRPDAVFHVIGMIPEAREHYRSAGVSDMIREHGPVLTDADLSDFLASISVFAHGNDTGESFGLTIAEAMAAGLPVVTHPCPPPRDNAQLELVDHGTTGFHAGTAEDFARAVARLLDDPDLARKMGEAGQKKAAAHYRAQDIAAQLESIYLDLLAGKTTGGTP